MKKAKGIDFSQRFLLSYSLSIIIRDEKVFTF